MMLAQSMCLVLSERCVDGVGQGCRCRHTMVLEEILAYVIL